ncbi:hypothetical protein VN24_13085 [Paenibacillus beijingensis]|uniref:HTH araC/xylS-type domain-containing protein n=2 Tax=Paenibacillus beijingensis TaxID=1126833 RepID=A0A0D5NQX2_9BACL|nr:hypothetical protein VN24_13085 [Paenibacillus beijingensis]
MNKPWRFVPAAISHVYWNRKEQFEMKVDTYDEWVLFAVTEGRFRYRIEVAEGVSGFGDIVFCPPKTPFHREAIEPVSFHFYRFRWEPAPSLPNDPLSAEPRPVGNIEIVDRSRLSSNYFYLKQLSGLEDEQQLASIQSLFGDLWHLICRELNRNRVQDEQMLMAARWLQEHASKPLRIRDLAAAIYINPVQLTRRFQAAWGRTPIDYLTSLRIERAKSLLLETDMTLDDIAENCGYENGFYLSRVFTKVVKIAPSRFRKMNRL